MEQEYAALGGFAGHPMAIVEVDVLRAYEGAFREGLPWINFRRRRPSPFQIRRRDAGGKGHGRHNEQEWNARFSSFHRTRILDVDGRGNIIGMPAARFAGSPA